MTNTGFTSMVNTKQTYPNGNAVDREYDILYRKLSIIDAGVSPSSARSPSPSGDWSQAEIARRT